MSFFDLLALVFENLGRRKARVALTAIGVVIGTAAVVVLVSLAVGLQRSATESLGNIGDLKQIQVMPGFGGGGGGGGGGGPIVFSSGPGKGGGENQTLITDDSLRTFATLPGVVAVLPRDALNANMLLELGKLQGGTQILGLNLRDLTDIGLTAQEGALTLAKGTVVVGSMVKNSFYDPKWRPGQPPFTPPDLMGQQLKVTLIRYAQDGTEVRKVISVRVTGVIAETRGEADYSMYMPLEEVNAYNEWNLKRRINRNKDGYQMALVRVEEVDKVLDVTDQITQMGYQAFTPQQFVQGINSFFIVLQVIFGGVGAIALLVAAIGIANTMTMAILERTREIGLMKAIGATNRDVLSVFLGEAAGIGFIGGLGGVTLGWLAGQVINTIAIAYLAQQAQQGGGPPLSDPVYTPLWLPIFALVFATIIGLLSGLYPALRAATLVPVMALKYE